MNKSGRLTELDSLRGLAATSVVLFHLTFWYDSYHISPLQVPWGHYGVELFFIISGFVIFMSLARTSTVSEFAVSRAARLIPAYWACVALTSLLANVVPLTWDNSRPSAALVAINLTMLQRFLMFPDIDSSYWTLAIELSFYAMMALAFRTGWLPNMERLCLGWLVLAAATRLGLAIAGESRNLGPISSITGLFYGQFFIIGICLYRMTRGESTRLTGLVLACACSMSLFGGGPYSLHAPPLIYLTVTLLLTALVWCSARGLIPFLCWAPLVLIGEISYPLYLVHQRVGTMAMRAAHDRGYAPWVQLGLAISVVALLAWLIHSSIEVPGRAFVRALLRDPLDARRRPATRVTRL